MNNKRQQRAQADAKRQATVTTAKAKVWTAARSIMKQRALEITKARLAALENDTAAACLRQKYLDETNQKLRELKEEMEQQREVIKNQTKTRAETFVWMGLGLATSGCSKLVQIPLNIARAKEKRQATKEFRLSQLKAADLYYCYIEREGDSETGLVTLPNRLLLTKVEWQGQRGELL